MTKVKATQPFVLIAQARLQFKINCIFVFINYLMMKNIEIEATHYTPYVHFDFTNGLFEMKGISKPEDSNAFYLPLIDWITKYAKNPKPKTEVHIHLRYFNTSSMKQLLVVFRIFETILEAGNDTVIHWMYESDDEEMLEAGCDFQSIVDVPFIMEEI